MAFLDLATDPGLPIRISACPEITEEESVDWLPITGAQAHALFSGKTDLLISGNANLTIDYYLLDEETCDAEVTESERHEFSGSAVFPWTARIHRGPSCYPICAGIIAPGMVRVSGAATGTVAIVTTNTVSPVPGSGTSTATEGPPYVIIGTSESIPQADDIEVGGWVHSSIFRLARIGNQFYLYADLRIWVRADFFAGYDATLLISTQTRFDVGDFSFLPDDLVPDGTLTLSLPGGDLALPYFLFDTDNPHTTDDTDPCGPGDTCTCVHQDLGTETFALSGLSIEQLAEYE